MKAKFIFEVTLKKTGQKLTFISTSLKDVKTQLANFLFLEDKKELPEHEIYNVTPTSQEVVFVRTFSQKTQPFADIQVFQNNDVLISYSENNHFDSKKIESVFNLGVEAGVKQEQQRQAEDEAGESI